MIFWLKAFAICIALLLAGAIGLNLMFPWATHAVAPSPDGKRSVVVRKQQVLLGEHKVQVILLDGDGSKQIIRDGRGEARSPQVTEVVWWPDSSIVGVLVCDDMSQNILLGYNVQERRLISEEVVTEALRHALRTRYGLQPDQSGEENPIRWACESSKVVGRFASAIGATKTLPPLSLDQ
jgi:hypothetical protein